MTKIADDINVNNDDQIVQLKEDLAQMEGNWKRALADYKNLQKRVQEEKEFIITFANVTLIESLLPILDTMELLDAHSQDQGLSMTVKEFEKVLQSAGLAELEIADKDFDENIMEAVETVPGEKNKVIEVLKKGYLYRDKIIRPAYVKVGQGE